MLNLLEFVFLDLIDSFFLQYSVFKVQCIKLILILSGDYEIRTRDPLLARQVLSQLS